MADKPDKKAETSGLAFVEEDHYGRVTVAPYTPAKTYEATGNPLSHITLPFVGDGTDTATRIPVKTDHIKSGTDVDIHRAD